MIIKKKKKKGQSQTKPKKKRKKAKRKNRFDYIKFICVHIKKQDNGKKKNRKGITMKCEKKLVSFNPNGFDLFYSKDHKSSQITTN